MRAEISSAPRLGGQQMTGLKMQRSVAPELKIPAGKSAQEDRAAKNTAGIGKRITDFKKDTKSHTDDKKMLVKLAVDNATSLLKDLNDKRMNPPDVISRINTVKNGADRFLKDVMKSGEGFMCIPGESGQKLADKLQYFIDGLKGIAEQANKGSIPSAGDKKQNVARPTMLKTGRLQGGKLREMVKDFSPEEKHVTFNLAANETTLIQGSREERRAKFPLTGVKESDKEIREALGLKFVGGRMKHLVELSEAEIAVDQMAQKLEELNKKNPLGNPLGNRASKPLNL